MGDGKLTRIYFIRHVQASGNINRIFQGQIDTDVSEQGRIQMNDLAKRFGDVPLDAIYVSPLKRAMATAKAVQGERNISLIADDRLKEIGAGIWEGVPLDTIGEKYADDLEVWRTRLWDFQVEGSESCRGVYARTAEALDDIIKSNPGKTVAVVSHGCSLRNLLCYAMGYKIEEMDKVSWLGNASITQMIFEGGAPGQLQYINDQSHITPETILQKPNILK